MQQPMEDSAAKPVVHWVGELQGMHKDDTCFVLGNGASLEFYDVKKAREKHGVYLIGCNKLWEKYPLHYLVWQDSNVSGSCASFPGIKVVVRRQAIYKTADPNTTFYYTYGKYNPKISPNRLELCHSGGIAMQLAILLGFRQIILAGCDCRVFKFGDMYKSNIFEDKQVRRVLTSGNPKFLVVDGKLTTPHLQGFVGKFHKFYDEYKTEHEIYQLGNWGLITKIPSIDFPDLWTNKHPEEKKDVCCES